MIVKKLLRIFEYYNDRNEEQEKKETYNRA